MTAIGPPTGGLRILPADSGRNVPCLPRFRQVSRGQCGFGIGGRVPCFGTEGRKSVGDRMPVTWSSFGPVRAQPPRTAGRSGQSRIWSGLPQSPATQVRQREFRMRCWRLLRRGARGPTPTLIWAARAMGPVWLDLHSAGTVRPESCRPAPQGSPRFPDFGFRCRSDARTPPMRRTRS